MAALERRTSEGKKASRLGVYQELNLCDSFIKTASGYCIHSFALLLFCRASKQGQKKKGCQKNLRIIGSKR